MPIPTAPDQLKLIQLPTVWSPAGVETSADGSPQSIQQAQAGLLLAVSPVEAALRLLMNEVEVEPVNEPPKGYDPDQQGEWNPQKSHFRFKRAVRLMRVEKNPNGLDLEYNFGDLGYWTVSIEADNVRITRV
jgi:hypothetical protein